MQRLSEMFWAKGQRANQNGEHSQLDAAIRGERPAFESIITAYKDALRGFVEKRVGPQLTDDVLQETWIAAWMSLPRFDRRSQFKTWLYSIALRKCRDSYKEQKPEQLPNEEPVDKSDAFQRSDLTQDVKRALDQLSQNHRELLELYYFEEFTLPEIAEMEGINLNTLKYQFYKAHEEISKRLDMSMIEISRIEREGRRSR